LILASLLIAFVIWIIAKRGDMTQETFIVSVYLKGVPENVLTNMDRRSVNLTLPIPNQLRSRTQAELFRAEIDFAREKELEDPRNWCGIEDFRPSQKINIDTEHIRILTNDPDLRQRLQRQLQYASINFGELVIYGKLITRPAQIVFRTNGEPAPGFRLKDIQASVAGNIRLTASEETFQKLSPREDAPVPIETESIDLAGRSADFSQTVGLRLPQYLDLVFTADRRIEARISLEEITTTIENVRVEIEKPVAPLSVQYLPQTVTLTVRANEKMLAALKKEYFVVRPIQKIEPQPGLEVVSELRGAFSGEMPRDMIDMVFIRSVSPSRCTLRFMDGADSSLTSPTQTRELPNVDGPISEENATTPSGNTPAISPQDLRSTPTASTNR
jgi:hypothetical protein